MKEIYFNSDIKNLEFNYGKLSVFSLEYQNNTGRSVLNEA